MNYLLDFLHWLSTVTVLATIAALAVPVGRDVVVRWIAGRIQVGVDSRIETLRSELRKAEETFKGEIRANEQRFNSAVNVALTSLSGRQSVLITRRLRAVDELWAHKAKLDSAKPAVQLMSMVKFEVAAKQSAQKENVRTVFKILDMTYLSTLEKHMSENKLPLLEAERPYLSPVLWALYAAYSAVVFHAVGSLKFLASGIGDHEVFTDEPTDELLMAALPDLSADVAKYSANRYYQFLTVLETRLLIATEDMLAGKEADTASLEQAQSILQAASRVTVGSLEGKIPEELKADAPSAEPSSSSS
jgi:hypothetical protein